MPHTVLGADKGAEFEKIAAVSGLKTKQLAPVVSFNNFAFPDFRQQAFYLKARIQWADVNPANSEYAGQIADRTGFDRCLIH